MISIYDLELPDSFLALLKPAFDFAHLATTTKTIRQAPRGYSYPRPYRYTQVINSPETHYNGKTLFCCLLHIHSQFLEDVSYFDNVAVMLQAFAADQRLIFFLDAHPVLPLSLRNLLRCARQEGFTYITLEELQDISSKDVPYLDRLLDVLGLSEQDLGITA